MDKNSTLVKRLSRYTAMAGGVAAVTTGNAQVVYTDVSPDEVLNTGEYYLVNMNNSGPNEFGLIQYLYTSSALNADFNQVGPMSSASSAQVAYGTTSFFGSSVYIAQGFTAGQPIGPAATFGNHTDLVIGGYATGSVYGFPFSSAIGSFVGATKFIGVKFNISGSTHYGWIRVSTPADCTTLTIYDYAYESTPNTPIQAGNMIGVNEAMLETIQISQNLGQVLINFKDIPGKKNVELISLLGEKISNDQCTTGNAQIDITDLTSGVYIVNVTHEAGSVAKKIYIK